MPVPPKRKMKVHYSDSDSGSERMGNSSDEGSYDSDSRNGSGIDSDVSDKVVKKEKRKHDVSEEPGFDLPTSAEEPKIFVLCGSCASGKSHMLKHMFYLYGKRKQYKFGLCFTSTAFTGDYDYLPEKSIRDFDMNYLENYMKHLRAKIVDGKAKHGSKWNLPHNFLIIDDSIGLVNNSGFFLNMIATHRHTKTTIFLLSQLLTAARSVNTVVRANTSFAMLWPTSMRIALEGIHRSYGQMYDYEEFKTKLDNCRKRKFSCLVFKNNPEFSTPQEAYCEILAPAIIPEFQLDF
jgi:hypothetical protein